MTDFPAARTADRTTFADAEAGEVVIEHEFLGILVDQSVDALFIAAGSQRDGDQAPGFRHVEKLPNRELAESS